MKIETLSLAQIVTSKPETAGIFESYNLDYCCKGKQKFSEVLIDEPIKHASLLNKLEEIFKTNAPKETDFTKLTLSDLADYILQNHHKYVNENIPLIKQHLEKVISKHGNKFPTLVKIRELFENVSRELENHMMKEEKILFPRIKMMESLHAKDEKNIPLSIQAPIQVMESEHETAGNLLAEIRELSNNYTPDENACMTHRVCIDELKMFENDLHLHVHLENNILFPKAIEMENNIVKSIHVSANL